MTSKGKGVALGRAELEFDAQGTPRSTRFADTYYDAEDGLGESEHVFLAGCELPDAWADRATFTIGETGFGTGLNFLTTWRAWQNAQNRPHRLHYISVEGFPLSPDELRASLNRWHDLEPIAKELIENYPAPQPGYHRRFFADGQITLTLLFGPVRPMLESLDADVDAWFLDGFAPDRNPDMWHPDVFQELARLSQPDARLATFTVAGQVRRDLNASGFTVEKKSGWGNKREVLAGRFKGPAKKQRNEPWYRRPKTNAAQSKSVAVIGSGLAGAFTAHAFLRRGRAVTVIDRNPDVAAEASATPAAVLMPRLTAGASTDGDFYASAWSALLSALKDIENGGHDIGRQRCGTLQLAQNVDEERRQAAIIESERLQNELVKAVSAAEATRLTGVTVKHGGLFFPDGGYLSPRRLCAALLDGATVRTNQNAMSLECDGDKWVIKDQCGGVITAADDVVIAGAVNSVALAQSSWLPLSARMGQITRVTPTETSRSLQCVVAGEGYVTPAIQGLHVIGATFDHMGDGERHERPTPNAEADGRNLEQVKTLAPGLLTGSTWDTGKSWIGVRCTTSDHLPMAGPLPNHAGFLTDYSELRHGHRWSEYPDARYHDGLFVLTGLGAHGTVAAPLAAELIASQACGDPAPMPRGLANALHPGRFIVRDLKRLKV